MALESGNEEVLLLIKAFEANQVKYLIVGGFAVNHYGYKRTTGDVDIYLKDTPENRANLIKALADMGYGHFDMLMTVPIIAGYCEIMMDNGVYADLMTNIPGLQQESFDEYFEMASLKDIEGSSMRFLHYNHLIQNKEATNRNKDKLDVAELRRIKEST